jgi:hypothetical protein
MAVEREDKFDEMRRAWIAAHQGWSTIQRRRAELLGRKVRARQRAVANSVADPHDDTILPPLWMRTVKSPASQAEMVAVYAAAVIVPLGWIGGRLVNCVVVRLIPGTLRAYPIGALMWAGALLGFLIVLFYDPGPTLGQILLAPWICVQVAAVPVVAGAYGIAEGWLAVSGSAQWWPLAPPKRPINAEDASEILGGYDITGPGLLNAEPLNQPGER